jgi:hypothetical protein
VRHDDRPGWTDDESGVVAVIDRPARETIAFVVMLAALAVFGGVTATVVASADATTAAPAGDWNAGADSASADPNATIDYDGERLVVEQTSNQTITGETTLDPGTQVTVRARSANSASPFLRSSVATVADNGTFAAEIDFAEVADGTEFTITVHYNGTRLTEAPGVVGGCDPVCGETPAFGEGIVAASAGETIEIPVELNGADRATVYFGGDAVNVHIPVTVEDGNGDGVVVLQIASDTGGAGGAGVSTKAAADDASVAEAVDRPQALAPGEYPMELYAGSQFRDTEPVDVGTVVLSEATNPPRTERSNASTTTVGTIYETNGTTPDSANGGGIGMLTLAMLGGGGILAVLGVLALTGTFD